MTTIKQIAAIAGVSRGTVDRALNGRDGVKKEVRERILEIARQQGYTPNKAARALATAHKPLKIGVVMPAAGNPFFEEVKAGLSDACAELANFGLELTVRQTEGYNSDAQANAITDLTVQGMDGLLVAPIDTPRIRALLEKNQLPRVFFNSDLPGADRLCYIGQDYYKSGQTAAGLLGLFTTGEVRAAVVTGSLQMPGHSARVRGFTETIKACNPRINVTGILENGDNDGRSYALVMEILRTRNVNALVLTAGGVTGAMRAVTESGRKVRVITYDAPDETVRYLQTGAISATICQDPHAQGYRACKALFDYLSDGISPTDFHTAIDIRIRENI